MISVLIEIANEVWSKQWEDINSVVSEATTSKDCVAYEAVSYWLEEIETSKVIGSDRVS